MSKCFQPIVPAELIWKEGLPYSKYFEDIYFSEEGLHESSHVFIEGNNLRTRFEAFSPKDPQWPYFVIGECGFGTGLNFLLAVQCFQRYAPVGAQLHFFSVEKHPLSQEDLARSVALWPTLTREAEMLLMHYPSIHTPGSHHAELQPERIFLNLLLGDADEMWRGLVVTRDPHLEARCRDWHVDAWFLDGFAPNKNEAMWSTSLLEQIALLSRPGTTLATFTAAGWVRRGLSDVGFQVQKVQGYGRKREMCTGIFELAKLSAQKRQTPWHVSVSTRPVERKAIVLGAGLAGSFIAHALAKSSWEVTLIDERPREASQASNNSQAVLYPNLSIYYAPLTNLMLHAYTHAVQVYQSWINDGFVEGELHGMMQLAMKEKVAQYHASLAPWLAHYPHLARQVNADEASRLTGIGCHSSGLYLPNSGWVNMKSLCAFLIDSPRINRAFNQSVTALKKEHGLWKLGAHEAPVLVVATGHQAALFEQTSAFSLFPFQGQMTAVEPLLLSQNLKIPICAEGHITPVHEGVHWIGATYHQGKTDAICTLQDDEMNMARYHTLTSSSEDTHIRGHWSGVRASTRDHLPLVGAVPDAALWRTTFEGLKTNRLRFIPHTANFIEGLYLFAGFGSRGLTTIPWSAAYLASLIEKKPFSCSKEIAQSLSPARLLF